jgi:hypothetical protein
MFVVKRLFSSDCDKCDSFSDNITRCDVKVQPQSSGVHRNYMTSRHRSMRYMTMVLLVTFTLLCYTLPLAHGMAYLGKSQELLNMSVTTVYSTDESTKSLI